ncbi:MAG TPA: hypothetical protein PLM79_04720 [Syntrophobacteraceae bacterium]|nr:hypothetical protein [Syntrophobacteraceae bacterium]
MEQGLGRQLLDQFLREHWISGLFLTVTLTTVGVLLCARWWLRRRWKKILEESREDQELDLLTPLGPKDREALEIIRSLRREVWEWPEGRLQLSVEALTALATRIIQSIAAVYHGTAGTPEYEASLVELLQLMRRVGLRLSRLTAIAPFRFFGSRRISDYQRYYQVYRRINDHPILRVVRRNPVLYRLARWAVHIKNLGNPFYWAGREVTREGYFFTLRWFHLAFISQVGREAMRVYSGRSFQKEEDRDAALVCYRLFALTRRWGGPTAEEWAALVDFVATQVDMENEVRLQVLSRMARGRLPAGLESQKLQTSSGQKWYRQGLKGLLEKDSGFNPIKKQLLVLELSDVQ